MTSKIDVMCQRFAELVNSFRDELVRSFETYLSTKIGVFRSQIAKLEVHKNDLTLMQNDIRSNDENIKKASVEHLTSSRFGLIVDKFDAVNTTLRNVR